MKDIALPGKSMRIFNVLSSDLTTPPLKAHLKFYSRLFIFWSNLELGVLKIRFCVRCFPIVIKVGKLPLKYQTINYERRFTVVVIHYPKV